LHALKSAGISRCACIITVTLISAPGSTIPVFGLTQYFFGEVVFTLNACFAPVGFFNTSSAAHCFLSSTAFRETSHSSIHRQSPVFPRHRVDHTRASRVRVSDNPL
jgi:hypothetical protein